MFTRGNNRSPVFLDPLDYAAWLALLDRTVRRFGWACHAYCVLPNHYHLLLESSRNRISRGMRDLNGCFAQRINARYERTGHVFERPYREELVLNDAHLLEVIRYVPLNPVRAGLCRSPEEWQWSSYLATAQLARRPTFLTVSFVRSLFGRSDTALERYRRFVSEGVVSRTDTSRDLVPSRGPSGR